MAYLFNPTKPTSERRLLTKTARENPELLLVKEELRTELESAVGAALARLGDRERLVLRLYLVSGMTLASIGKSFGVTQQTISADCPPPAAT